MATTYTRSSKIINRPTGGGNKKQGLTSTTNKRSEIINIIQKKSWGTNRNVVFFINQLGGIGRHRSQFGPVADGLHTNSGGGFYTLQKFRNDLKSELSHDYPNLLELLNYFENFQYKSIYENYVFRQNTPNRIVKLYQSDFDQGTVRITIPGIYILQEDIYFKPNESNDFMPTTAQISSGQYPGPAQQGAYHLGFFAAITIETTGVILDLNGFSLQQSFFHYLQQRFYANIELAAAPFVLGQGPGNFGSQLPSAKYAFIKNGTLGLSSHHGIHGNQMSNIILQDIVFRNFDLAGISLNGGINMIFDNLDIQGTKQDVPVLGNYSQARFARVWLQKAIDRITDTSWNFPQPIIDDLSLQQIQIDLSNALNDVKDFVIDHIPLPSDSAANIFINDNSNQGLDGNVYGISLNVTGVLVNDFLKERDASCASLPCGNKYIFINNVQISNIRSHPRQVLSLSGPSGEKNQKGQSGDVLAIETVTDSSYNYKGNVFANTQIGIASTIKPGSVDFSGGLGTTSIRQPIVTWAEPSGQLIDVIIDNNYNYIYGEDLMAHVMKGNIGFFISGGENITLKDVEINTVTVFGQDVSACSRCTPPSNSGAEGIGVAQGGDAHGVLLTASTNITFINVDASNIKTNNPDSSNNIFTHINDSSWNGTVGSII